MAQNPAMIVSKGRVALTLWWLGLWESLQLQRCIVFFVLDRSSSLGGKVLHCFLLNGCIFMGSIAWWTLVLQPLVRWLLRLTLQPLWGALPARLLEGSLHGLFQVLWLLPAYAVTLMVSCICYQEIATLAVKVKKQEYEQQEPPQQLRATRAGGVAQGQQRVAGVQVRSPAVPARSSSSSSSSSTIEDVAQELYRVVFFLVLYAEIWLLGNIPYAGKPLYFIFLCWLYAYYCYDYKWSLMAVRLPERLTYFERRWAFFAGFGVPMSVATMALSFYVGASVLAVLFPLFILVACDSEPSRIHASLGSETNLGQIPIFNMALWPTEKLLGLVFKMKW